MVFKINLATKIYINARLLQLCLLAAILLLTSFLFINVTNIAAKAGEMKSLATRLAATDEKNKAANNTVSEKEFTTLLGRINFANAIIEKKMYNWLELLDRLEMVVPDGIAISSLEPNVKGQELKLAGIANSFKNLRTFMERLEDSGYFSDLYLLNQGDAKLGGSTQGISFTLTCKVIKK